MTYTRVQTANNAPVAFSNAQQQQPPHNQSTLTLLFRSQRCVTWLSLSVNPSNRKWEERIDRA